MLTVILLSVSLALANGLDRPRRVVGGELAMPNQFPFMASIQKDLLGRWYHICGAVWLGGNRMLTTAHCIVGITVDHLRVVMGNHNLVSGNTSVFQVANYVTHPQYDGNSPGFPNDIALMRLRQFPVAGPNMRPAIMPQDTNNEFVGECAILGWGTTSGSSSAQDQLHYVNLTAIRNTDCALQWQGVTGSTILDTHICAYGFNKGACHEDTGGPLVCGRDHEVAGLVSWGIHACVGYPTVHTRITKFLDWISFH